jgi:hypothetical protein
MNAYMGIHGLSRAGFCAIRKHGNQNAWPRLNYWTQEVTAAPESSHLTISPDVENFKLRSLEIHE